MNTIIVTDKTILYGSEVSVSSLWCRKNAQCNLQNPRLKLQLFNFFHANVYKQIHQTQGKNPNKDVIEWSQLADAYVMSIGN